MPWWVGGIANQSAPSTASPYYFQAADRQAAVAVIGGNPLAGPFATEAQAQAWAKGPGAGNFGPGKTNIAPPVDTPLTAGIPGPGASGLAGIGDFFGRLTEASTWIRVAEVVLGVILLAVGVARITHAVPAATRAAKMVGAVAI